MAHPVCGRCLQDWTDDRGVKQLGEAVPSHCPDCGVCEDCEHWSDCTRLKKYFVQYGDHNEYFVCEAENAHHAAEQCDDFLTGGIDIHGIWEGKQDDNWI